VYIYIYIYYNIYIYILYESLLFIIYVSRTPQKNDFLWDRIMSEHHLHQHQPTSWIHVSSIWSFPKSGSEIIQVNDWNLWWGYPVWRHLHVVWSTFVCPNIGYSTKRRPTTSIPKTCRARTVPEAQLSCPVSWWKKPTAGTGKPIEPKKLNRLAVVEHQFLFPWYWHKKFSKNSMMLLSQLAYSSTLCWWSYI